MNWNRGLSVWQKLKDFFSQILGSLWKGHNKRLRGHTIDKTTTNQNHKESDRTRSDGITYLKQGNVVYIFFSSKTHKMAIEITLTSQPSYLWFVYFENFYPEFDWVGNYFAHNRKCTHHFHDFKFLCHKW